MGHDAFFGNIGRPHSTNVWCPHDIGREVWDRVEQQSAVWQDLTPRTRCANVAGVFPLSEVRTRRRLGEFIVVVVVVDVVLNVVCSRYVSCIYVGSYIGMQVCRYVGM